MPKFGNIKEGCFKYFNEKEAGFKFLCVLNEGRLAGPFREGEDLWLWKGFLLQKGLLVADESVELEKKVLPSETQKSVTLVFRGVHCPAADVLNRSILFQSLSPLGVVKWFSLHKGDEAFRLHFAKGLHKGLYALYFDFCISNHLPTPLMKPIG